MRTKAVLSILMLFLTTSAIAGTARSGYRNIEYFEVKTNGVHLVLEGFDAMEQTAECTSNAFVIENDLPNFDAMVSTALAAVVANRTLQIKYDGCLANGKIRAIGVFLQPDA